MNHQSLLHFTGSVQHQVSIDGWPVSMSQSTCAAGQLRIESAARHILLVNVGESAVITDRFERETIVVEKDAVICMLPEGTTAEMSWVQELQIRIFAFDPEYVSKLLPGQKKFQPRWKIVDEILAGFSNRICAAMSVSHFPERTYAESLAVLCIEQLSRQDKAIADEVPGRGKLSPRQLLTVIAFAHDSIQQDIGLVDMANLVHLSAYHFGRLFKQTIGLSPYQYILQLRIEYAKKLILEKAGPLGEIAYQLNFSDQAHFSNAFRKATGLSPRQYQHGQPALI
jgi:AraC family transcriptional regulator